MKVFLFIKDFKIILLLFKNIIQIWKYGWKSVPSTKQIFKVIHEK